MKRKGWLRLAKFGAIALILWEIRGAILAAPVFYALWTSGGDAMKIWLAFCALAGLALSVLLPRCLARWIGRRFLAKKV